MTHQDGQHHGLAGFEESLRLDNNRFLESHRFTKVTDALCGHYFKQGCCFVYQLWIVIQLALGVAKNSFQEGNNCGRVQSFLSQQLSILDGLVPVAHHRVSPHQLPMRHFMEHFVLLLNDQVVVLIGFLQISGDLDNLVLGHLVQDALSSKVYKWLV